jgi:hypothetical protein
MFFTCIHTPARKLLVKNTNSGEKAEKSWDHVLLLQALLLADKV